MKKQITILSLLIIFLGNSFLSKAQAPNYVPKNGLLGWYPLNGNANNEQGAMPNAKMVNVTPITGHNNEANGALSFNGINSLCTIDSGSSYLTNKTELTMSVWAYSLGRDTNIVKTPFGAICGIRNNVDANFYILHGSTFSEYRYTGINGLQYTASGSVAQNAWKHYLFVKKAETIEIYENGILNLFNFSTTSPITIQNLPFNIGALSFNTDSFYYHGYIDDLGVWDRALTPLEVHGLFKQTVGLPNSQKNNLDIQFYPNPAKEKIFYNNLEILKNLGYEIIDLNGRVVKKGFFDSSEGEIEISNLAKGMYLITCTELIDFKKIFIKD